MKKNTETVLEIIGLICLVVSVLLISTWIFMLLWNVVAGYFGFKDITFWISACIVLLLSYLKPAITSSKK